MIRFTQDYIDRFDEKVICECCGKQMHRGEKITGFNDIVCAKCVINGYHDKDKKRKN